MQPPSNYPPGSPYPYSPAPGYAPPPPAKRRGGCGCFGTGCLIVVLLLVLLGLVIGVGGYFLANKLRDDYTADHPEPVRIYPATDAQYAEVSARMKTFGEALRNKQRAALELTADDLNTLIAKDPDLAWLKGRAFCAIDKDLLNLAMSFPLEQIPGVGGYLRGRWFNGRASGELTLFRGEFRFIPHLLEANGKRLGPDFMKGFTTRFNESFNEELRKKNPEAVEVLRQIETFDVGDGKIRIVTRAINTASR